MHKNILNIILFFSILFSAEYKDVIYLKDGSIIYGNIIEHRPDEYYKIESGSNILEYSISEISDVKMKMGNIIVEENEISNISDKTWTIGLGNSKTSTIFKVMKEFKINDHFSFGFYFSPKIHEPKHKYGIGFSIQEKFNQSGKFINVSFGKYPDSYGPGDDRITMSNIFHAGIGYQIKSTKNNSVYMIGITYMNYIDRLQDWQDFQYTLWSETKELTLPLLSWNYKF